MSYDEIEVCAQNIDTILGSIAIITIEEKENLHFDLLRLLHFNSNSIQT